MEQDTKMKTCKHCKKEIDAMATRCPHCQGKNYVWTKSKKIIAICVGIFLFLAFSGMLSSSSSSPSTSSVKSIPIVSEPQLELVSYHCDKEYSYFIFTGQVKNISSQSLKNVEAVGTAYTKGGEFVNSEASLIEYNPILPGQTSPFKVMITDNPAMSKCNVDFKYLMGGSIDFKDNTAK